MAVDVQSPSTFLCVSPWTLSIPGIAHRILNHIFSRNTRYFHKYYLFLLQIICEVPTIIPPTVMGKRYSRCFWVMSYCYEVAVLNLGSSVLTSSSVLFFGHQKRSINTWLLVGWEGTNPIKWKADLKWLLCLSWTVTTSFGMPDKGDDQFDCCHL